MYSWTAVQQVYSSLSCLSLSLTLWFKVELCTLAYSEIFMVQKHGRDLWQVHWFTRGRLVHLQANQVNSMRVRGREGGNKGRHQCEQNQRVFPFRVYLSAFVRLRACDKCVCHLCLSDQMWALVITFYNTLTMLSGSSRQYGGWERRMEKEIQSYIAQWLKHFVLMPKTPDNATAIPSLLCCLSSTQSFYLVSQAFGCWTNRICHSGMKWTTAKTQQTLRSLIQGFNSTSLDQGQTQHENGCDISM